MSKHWFPDHDCVPLRATTPPRPPRARLSSGSKAGLLMVAFTCGGVVLGLNQMFGRVDVFAEELVATSERAESGARAALTER